MICIDYLLLVFEIIDKFIEIGDRIKFFLA